MSASDSGVNSPPANADVLVQIKQPRNLKHHRKYWGLLRLVVDATGNWPSVDAMHRWLKLELRMFTPTELVDGRLVLEWDSIAVESMDQREFSAFYERAIAAIIMETGIDPITLMEETGG